MNKSISHRPWLVVLFAFAFLCSFVAFTGCSDTEDNNNQTEQQLP